jgi:DNA polymerase V
VVLERTVREMQGRSCIDLDHAPAPKHEIACTRSFGHPVTEFKDLSEAVTEFASRAAVKLRKQASLVGQVLVFIHTSPFRKDPQYSRSTNVPLRRPSADTAVIVSAALAGLRAIYRPTFKYAKAGVMLLDLQSNTVQQGGLDLQDDDGQDRGKLMLALDGLNQRYGRGTLKMASAGLAGDKLSWSMKQERRTPRYTTCWQDIPMETGFSSMDHSHAKVSACLTKRRCRFSFYEGADTSGCDLGWHIGCVPPSMSIESW